MSPRRVVEAEPAVRVAPPATLPAVEDAGQDTGMVTIKTRVPIHLHLALINTAEANQRSLAGELRVAAQRHVEHEAKR